MRAGLLGLVLALAAVPAAAEPPAEPAGYRLQDYRAPTPATLTGATVLDTVAAEALWRSGKAIFIDVMPRPPKPANLPPGTLWRDRKRENIPGSIWLPNVGYGALNAGTESWFVRSLESITDGDKRRPMVFYCEADCWMSWNAAKRALELGYVAVYWFPEGTDTWKVIGLPTSEASPLPMPSPFGPD